MTDNKLAIVSGCAGFIGSHVSEALLNEGYFVMGIDNFITGSPTNIDLLKTDKNFQFMQHDLIKPLPKRITSLKPRIIIHLASPASPPDYQKFWLETMLVNSIGTLGLLELARKHNARFVFSSTSEVYGDPIAHPQPESYWGNVNSYGPRAMYDESKRFAEALIWNYRRVHRVNTGIVRIFNTYGPRMRPQDGRVVINFLTQAIQGKPLTIHGDGTQTRAFCYVDDMVAGILKMAKSNIEGPINLGNPREFTINELCQKIEQVVGKKLAKKHLARPENDPEKRRPDITIAKKLLGWQPRVDLEEGLRQTLEWLKITR
ncbi:SDR family oxidoreductase [Candidatus Berkelbacteria bacterium]|nr:SDR family oxidoreductase [Candidatus Berkelbacteria bacterium]